MPVEEILNNLILNVRSQGSHNERMLTAVIFDVWEQYQDKDMTDRMVRLKYCCDIATEYGNTIHRLEKAMSYHS